MHKLISKAGVKQFLKENKKRTSKQLYEQLNQTVAEILLMATKRATGNKRQTLMPHDL